MPPEFLRRFRCPLEDCRRLFISKSGWTQHIHSVHADSDVSFNDTQNAIEMIPNPNITLILPPQTDRLLYSSPPTSPTRSHENFEASDPFQVMECLFSASDASETEPCYPTEYHSVVNGIYHTSLESTTGYTLY